MWEGGPTGRHGLFEQDFFLDSYLFPSSPEERIMAVLFLRSSCFSQIREALRRRLSASVKSHLPPSQNNHDAKVAYLGMAYLDFLYCLECGL